MRTKTILGTKIGDTVLLDEDRSPIYIYPEHFYEIGLFGYWLLMWFAGNWRVIQFLGVSKE